MRRLVRAAVHHHRLLLGIAGLLCVAAATLGGTALDNLSGGGYTPAGSPAALAQQRLVTDYSLFVVTRFREELDRGLSLDDAIVTSTAITGRTVLFSALTVAVSIAALLLFPLYFLRSMAYAAIPVILIGATASITLLPAMLRLTGRHINRWDLLSRFAGPPRSTSEGWRRLANTVMRRPVLTGLPVVIVLVLLATPFLNVTFGLTDDRTMPASAPARQATDLMAAKFPEASRPTRSAVPRGQRGHPVHTRRRTGGRGPRRRLPRRSCHRTRPTDPDFLGHHLADRHRLARRGRPTHRTTRPRPPDAGVEVTGATAMLIDTKSSITERLPWAIALIVATTLVLLFLFTGSVLIPLKAIVVNTLSLTASFGAAVYIFQLSRIHEQFLTTGDNTSAVATGLAKTGRLITAAAAVVAAVLIALATSSLTILKMLGVGLAIAVVVDAVVVRGILVPAFMRLLGSANWWAPRWLRGVHTRYGLRE